MQQCTTMSKFTEIQINEDICIDDNEDICYYLICIEQIKFEIISTSGKIM